MPADPYQGVASEAELAENQRLMDQLRADLGLATPAPAAADGSPEPGRPVQ